MKKIFIVLFVILPFFLMSQSSEKIGTFVVLSATGSDPNWTVQGSFNSVTGFSASDITTDERMVVRYVNGVTHARNLYEITSVSASGSNLTLGVTRLTGNSTSFFPPGTHAIMSKTTNGYLYDVPNVSQELESYISNYNWGLAEGFKVDTMTVDADTLTLALEDGTEYSAVLPGASVTIDSGDIANYQLSDMPDNTIKGNNSGSSGAPIDLTPTQVTAMLNTATSSLKGLQSSKHYQLLNSQQFTYPSGSVSWNVENGYNGLVLADQDLTINQPSNYSNRDRLTLLIQAVGGDRTITFSASFKSSSGDNLGAVLVPQNESRGFIFIADNLGLHQVGGGQNRIQFVDESSTLGDIGTVDTVKFVGAGITSARTDNVLTVTVTGGIGGVADADYGDIIVTSTGSVWTIDTGAVTSLEILDGTITTSDLAFTPLTTSSTSGGDVSGVFSNLQIGSGVIGSAELASTAVSAGSYTNSNITVDADGRITAASSGSSSGGIDTLTSANNTIDISEITSSQYDIDVKILPLRSFIDTCYAVTISGGNSGSVLWVCANGGGITASFSGNKLTITGSSSVRLKNAYWTMVTADVQSSVDAGGVSNWVQVEFAGCRGNSSLTDIRVPSVTKTAIPGSGSLSVSNAASVDIDNNPVVSVVGVGSNALTMRVGGLTVGAQGYQLSFTGIH